MPQWKLQISRRLAVDAGGRFRMRGVGTDADVGDEIDRRDDVQPGINDAGVEELVVPGINPAGFYRTEYGIPKIRQLRVIKNFLEQPVFAGERK